MSMNLPSTVAQQPNALTSAINGRSFFLWAASLQRIAMGVLRLGLVVVLLWIGGLKFANYEADSIVALVANSPFASFLYHRAAPEYRQYMNREGEAIPVHHEWHKRNGTYPVARSLGIIIISLGVLIALNPFFPQAATLGSFLLLGMSCVTLSFLVTTPEAWVPALGDAQHGFPYLSGVGRLVIKDCIMLGAALVTMADSARAHLARSGEAEIPKDSNDASRTPVEAKNIPSA